MNPYKGWIKKDWERAIEFVVFWLTVLFILAALGGGCYGCGAWLKWVLH
jgi:hypothetical protein